MTTERKRGKPSQKMTRTALGRYMRWSWRYNTWQVQTREGVWKNASVPMARAYAAAGFPIGVQGPAFEPVQLELF